MKSGTFARAAVAVLLSIGTAAAGVALNSLPLQRGYYVDTGTPCSNASLANLVIMRRDGVGAGQVLHRFKRVEKTGPASYRVTADEIDNPDNPGTSVSEFEITGPSSFRWKTDFGVSTMRYCPQNDLPDPWNSNDIRTLVR